jgi:hypothetical protein
MGRAEGAKQMINLKTIEQHKLVELFFYNHAGYRRVIEAELASEALSDADKREGALARSVRHINDSQLE